MRYINTLSKSVFGLFPVLLAAQFMACEANAKPPIKARAIEVGIHVDDCQTCHNTLPGTEGRINLKENYAAAYDLDKEQLSRLKNLINGCQTGQQPNETTFLCDSTTPKPLTCKPPQVEDNKSKTCFTPTPKMPMNCATDDDMTVSALRLSNPDKVVVHAGQILIVGVTTQGDDRNIIMGLSDLPKIDYGRFYSAYNELLRTYQGMLIWKVPENYNVRSMELKFCALAWGGGKSAVHSGNQKLNVEILPKFAEPLHPDPTVSGITIARALYNIGAQNLEISGKVTWLYKSSQAERQAAILQPLILTNAEHGNVLANIDVNLDGTWSATIAIPGMSNPRIVDAVFQGRLVTELVRKFN